MGTPVRQVVSVSAAVVALVAAVVMGISGCSPMERPRSESELPSRASDRPETIEDGIGTQRNPVPDGVLYVGPGGVYAMDVGPDWSAVPLPAGDAAWRVAPGVDAVVAVGRVELPPGAGYVTPVVLEQVTRRLASLGAQIEVTGVSVAPGVYGEVGIVQYDVGDRIRVYEVITVGEDGYSFAQLAAPTQGFDQLLGRVEPYLLTLRTR